MMGRTHLLLGFNAVWLFELGSHFSVLDLEPSRFALTLVAAGTGALLPDLDASASLLQNLSVGGVRPLVPAAQLIHASLGHRGALHSLLGLSAVGTLALPLVVADPLVWLSLLLGFASHLAGDACTKSGVPLFFPRRQSVHLLPRTLRLSTGSLAEEGFFVAFALAVIVLLLRSLSPVL